MGLYINDQPIDISSNRAYSILYSQGDLEMTRIEVWKKGFFVKAYIGPTALDRANKKCMEIDGGQIRIPKYELLMKKLGEDIVNTLRK